MSKQYSLAELQKGAGEHFEKLHVDKLYATSDGQYFVSENRAYLHANPNRLKVTVIKPGVKPAEENDVPAVEALKNAEPSTEPKTKKKGGKPTPEMRD